MLRLKKDTVNPNKVSDERRGEGYIQTKDFHLCAAGGGWKTSPGASWNGLANGQLYKCFREVRAH